MLAEAMKRSLRPLTLPLSFLIIMTLIFGTILLFVEPCYKIDDCPFYDVPHSAYFAMVGRGNSIYIYIYISVSVIIHQQERACAIQPRVVQY